MERIPADRLTGILDMFRCSLDEDIEEFLRFKAQIYKNRGWCSVYLLVNENELETHGAVKVEGYFTLSNKVLQLSEKVSKSRRKKFLNGLARDDDHMHFILIGQLGKYIERSDGTLTESEVCAKDLLDSAFEIIYQVKERIPCRCALIECKDEPQIRAIYENYGFSVLQKDGKLVQYFKML